MRRERHYRRPGRTSDPAGGRGWLVQQAQALACAPPRLPSPASGRGLAACSPGQPRLYDRPPPPVEPCAVRLLQRGHDLAHILRRGRPSVRDRLVDSRVQAGLVHLRRQKAFDDADLRFLLRGQLRPVALAVEFDRLPRRDFTMPRRTPITSSSPIAVTPFGRAAMSASFSLARIMRSVEVRAVSPAFIDPFSASVNCSRKLIPEHFSCYGRPAY